MAARTNAETRTAAIFSTVTPRSGWRQPTVDTTFRQRFENDRWSERGDQIGGARHVVDVGGRRDEDDLVGADRRDRVQSFAHRRRARRGAHAGERPRRVVTE